MKLLNKSENWWLRLTIVLITLVSLSTLSYYNRQITQSMVVKSQSDSTAYYKAKCDTLQNQVDSLYGENFELNHWNGIQELILDELSHSKQKYKDIVNDIEKERNSNKYE